MQLDQVKRPSSFHLMDNLSWQYPFVQFGVGAFETMRYQNGRIALESYHKNRLTRALRHWNLDPHLIEAPWQMLHEKLVAIKSKKIHRIKLLIGLNDKDELCAHVFDQPHQDKTLRRKLMLYSPHSNQRNVYKSSSYEQHFLAHRDAVRQGWDDAIYITQDGHLLETSTAALFIKGAHGLLCVEQGHFLDSVVKTALLERFPDEVKTCKKIHIDQIQSSCLLMGNALQGLMAVASVSEVSRARKDHIPLEVEQEYLDIWNQRLFGQPA